MSKPDIRARLGLRAEGGPRERETDGATQAAKIAAMLLQFAEKNPGMTRVMVGDALVYENERLVARMNQFFDPYVPL